MVQEIFLFSTEATQFSLRFVSYLESYLVNLKKRCNSVDFVMFVMIGCALSSSCITFLLTEKWAEAFQWACGYWRRSVTLWRAVGHIPSPRRQQRPFLSLFMPMSSLQKKSLISLSHQNWSAAHQRSLSPQNLSTAPHSDPPPLTMPSAARALELGAARTPAALASFLALEEIPAISRSQPTVTSSK